MHVYPILNYGIEGLVSGAFPQVSHHNRNLDIDNGGDILGLSLFFTPYL